VACALHCTVEIIFFKTIIWRVA